MGHLGADFRFELLFVHAFDTWLRGVKRCFVVDEVVVEGLEKARWLRVGINGPDCGIFVGLRVTFFRGPFVARRLGRVRVPLNRFHFLLFHWQVEDCSNTFCLFRVATINASWVLCLPRVCGVLNCVLFFWLPKGRRAFWVGVSGWGVGGPACSARSVFLYRCVIFPGVMWVGPTARVDVAAVPVAQFGVRVPHGLGQIHALLAGCMVPGRREDTPGAVTGCPAD